TWNWANSADPTTTSGTTLYNSATALQATSTATNNTNNSWKSSTFTAGGRTYVSNGINNLGYVAAALYANGTWNGGQYYNNAIHSNANRPYLSINYTAPAGPPTCATLIGPANGATGVAHQGELAWNVVGGATSYDVYFGTAASPPLVSTSQTGTTYNVVGCLLPNTKYYWKVIPKNANGSATSCTTWSFTTDGKLNIYKNDWETATVGVFNTTGGSSVDGWLTNNNSATGGVWSSGYNNTWTVGNGTYAVSGNSVGVSGLYNGGLAGDFFDYWSDLGEIHRWIYRPFDMRGLRDIEVTFRWKAGGEANQDYGSVISSINSGANYLMHDQGGLYNDGKYWNSPSTIRTQTITFPATRNNQQNFILGFKWDDLSGNGIGGLNSFVVDDIVIKACPYEGNINSNVVGAGIYEWIPTGSTQATLTINGSHSCAQYQWEQSIDNGATWANTTGGSGATTVSYTTPSNLTVTTLYRCKVYFGTGCTGVYQDNSFAINLIPVCDAEITSVTPASATICSGTNTTITAVANNPSYSIKWYAASTGGSPLYTGDTFETPNLSTTTTYYVAAYDGSCESVRVPVTIEVNQVPASVNVSIGTPANGAAHHINVSWTAISGAWQYQIDYSWNNSQWFVGGFSTSTSYSLNLFDNPDREVFIRVKRYDGGGLPDCFTYAAPVYTAADNPGALTFGTVTGTSIQVIIPAETPVANPAHTTYSIYNETLGLYVQADGSLGATEAFQTKTAWSSTPVTGLDPETEYCFYAKAKNQDGDIRYEQPAQLMATQEFNSNVLVTGSSSPNDNVWFAPNFQNQINYFNPHQYVCDGGGIGYHSNHNNFWSNFVRLPIQNMTGLDTFDLTFTLSNSFTAGQLNNNFRFYIYDGTSYHSGIAVVKIGNNTYSPQGINNVFYIFDELRQCEPVTVTFDISGVTNKSGIFVYIEPRSGYNNSSDFYFFVDNVTLSEGGSELISCITTDIACEAEIVSVTGGTGCGSIILSAETNDDNVYEVNWYNEDNQLVHTGFTYAVNVIETSTFYVAASNGECESALVPVTATFVPTTAEIEYYETPTSICNPGYVNFYAETNDDGLYTVSWYDAATGGNLLGTGNNLNIYITETTTVWAAAVDGDCESSEREPITVTTNAKTWNGSVDSDWHNASNWTPAGVPTISNCVIIPAVTNSPIISSGNGNARSITMLEGASMLVETGGAITVAQNLVLAEDQITGETLADFTLENDAYLYQPNNTSNNTNVGSITVHRNSTPMFRLDASGWGSPVENQKLYEFSPETVFGRIYEYDETDNVFVNTNITLNSVFVPAKGYSVRAPNGFPTYSGSATPEVFEGVFYGRPNNGDIGIELTKNDLGYNYVSNPYPSPIKADYLFDIPEVDALYFWTHEAPPINGVYAANNYAAYSMGGGVMAAAGGEIPDGIINVGQGFVAKVTGEFQLEFTNSMRNRESEGQFFRMANTEKHRYWLNLSDSEKGYNQILVGYIEDATMDLDHKIDAKLFGYSGSSLYSLVGNERLVIQGRSLPFNVADMVPLGFKAAQAGEFFIQIEKTDGLFLEEGQVIYLKDLYTNTTHNLTEDGAYHFVSEAGTFNERFEIHYQNSTLSAGNPNMTGMDWIAYQDADQIFVKSIGFDIENIEIYDLTGRLLIQEQDINAQSFSVPALFAEQVLIVKVNKTMVKKINYNN
ncbi:MAG: hypothetical protein RBT61_07205, partial [Candidatus Kapabacteria bacterium]|nr:hypothetical protein [Candidatus Kapabacteria bacterium]